MVIHMLMGPADPVFIYQSLHTNPIIVVTVVVINPQRLLVYINVLWGLNVSILLLSSSVFLPELSCSSNVPAFSDSLVTRTGKMCMKIHTFRSILIIRETVHLRACLLLKSSLFMKDGTLVLSRGTNYSVIVETCWSPQSPGLCPKNMTDAK